MALPMFQTSADVRSLVSALTVVNVGETVTYADLSKAVGSKVDGKFQALLRARHQLQRDQSKLFATIKGVGLKRMSDEDKVSNSASDAAKLRRHAKRSALRLATVDDFASLAPASQLRHTAAMSVFLAIREMASEKGLDRVASASAGRATELPIAETMRAFMLEGGG